MYRTLYLAVLASLCLTGVAFAQAPTKLNVVLIVGDDFNTNLGCYGHQIVKSPNIDRLAARGVRFERAYCNVPVCNPSRTSFLSGRRPKDPDKTAAVYLPNFFHEQGYHTVEAGKVRHSYGPSAEKAVFDEELKRPADAVAFLGRKHDQPFFLGVGLNHTHPGYAFTPQIRKLYPSADMPLLQEPADIASRVPADVFQNLNIQKLTADQHRKHVADYYAAISTLDHEVGNLMAALDERNLWDSTVVVLTSDHGRMLGEHGGIYDKRCLYEQSVRIPLIVAAPGHAGKTSSRLVENVDLYPTLAELCGLPAPVGLQGLSLVPLLRDPAQPWRTAAFSHSAVHPRGLSMRTERYRYTEWGNPDLAELYDHQTDPLEHQNLASDPNHADILRDVRKQFAAGWKAALPK